MRSLQDKVVAVTGAGSGIGRAVALEVARRGALVAVSDLDERGLAATVAQLGGAGAAVRGDPLDVADREAVAAHAAAVAAHFGRVNVVVNNAGVSMTGSLRELGYDELEWVMGVNYWGVVHGTKEFLPHLIASGDGHVVNISSLFGLIGAPGQAGYSSSKFAVRGFTEVLREEMLLERLPVGVSCVHPGGVRTGISRNGRKTAGVDGQALDAMFDEHLARTTPEKAATAIVRGILRNRARVLVGPDAHLVHQVARNLGSRYQDLVAAAARRGLPPPSDDAS